MYVVTGATGNVGSAVVGALAERGEPVRAVSRRARGGAPGVEAVAGDLDRPETFAAPLTGAAGIFLLAGYAGLPRLLELAGAAGVARARGAAVELVRAHRTARGTDPAERVAILVRDPRTFAEWGADHVADCA